MRNSNLQTHQFMVPFELISDIRRLMRNKNLSTAFPFTEVSSIIEFLKIKTRFKFSKILYTKLKKNP